MLFESAARLALIEALAPTAAISGAATFPTLANGNVYDSRRVAFTDLDDGDVARQAVISVYSGQAESVRRGEASPVDDRAASVVLELIVELAIRFNVDDQQFADADVANDPEAELRLSAIVAQIRRVIEIAPEGGIFRKVTKGAVAKFTSVPDVLPETGVRLARRFVTIELDMRDDDYPREGGMPEPLATLDALLPDASYAKDQLSQIALLFEPLPSDPFEGISIDGEHGPGTVGHINLTQEE